jgi:hypothetical protein
MPVKALKARRSTRGKTLQPFDPADMDELQN